MTAFNFTIPGSAWKNGTQLSTFNLADGAGRMTRAEASRLVNSYLICGVIQGSTVTYDRKADEFRLEDPDGTVEYVKYQRVIDPR